MFPNSTGGHVGGAHLTEGFYADRNMYDGNGEFSPVPGIGLSLRKITKEASLKIAESAFEIAQSRSINKKKIYTHCTEESSDYDLNNLNLRKECLKITSNNDLLLSI